MAVIAKNCNLYNVTTTEMQRDAEVRIVAQINLIYLPNYLQISKMKDLIKTGIALGFSIVSTAKQASPETTSLSGESERVSREIPQSIQIIKSGFKVTKLQKLGWKIDINFDLGEINSTHKK